MKEAQIVGDFLFPPNQQTAGSIEPGMRPFYFPTTGSTLAMRSPRRLVPFGRNMHPIATAADHAFNRLAHVSFIQTQMLRLARRGRWPIHWDVVESALDQLLIVGVGAIDRRPQRHTAAIDQHRTLHAQLASIGRVFPGFFPLPAATCSSPRPSSATPSR